MDEEASVIKGIAKSLPGRPLKQPLHFVITCDIQWISEEGGVDEHIMSSPGYTGFRRMYYRPDKHEFFCSCDRPALTVPIPGTDVCRLQTSLILEERFEYICNNPKTHCGAFLADTEAEDIETKARSYRSHSRYRLSFLLRRHIRHETEDCIGGGPRETAVPSTSPDSSQPQSSLTLPKPTKSFYWNNGITVAARKTSGTLECNPKKGVLCKCKGKEQRAIKVLGRPLNAADEVVLPPSIPI